MTAVEQQLAREYEQKRAAAEHARDQRIAEVHARDPEIARLQGAIAARFSEGARALASNRTGAGNLADALKRDVAALQVRVKMRLKALGLPEDYLESQYECAACRDTGFIGELNSEPCKCRKLRRVQLMRAEAGITEMRGQTFETFNSQLRPSDLQGKEAEKAKRLCEQYADGVGAGGKLNLLLTGTSGLGKTFLLNCIANRSVQRGVPTLVLTAFNMLEAMRDYHFGQNGEKAMLRQMMDCELLLIDDLGTEPMLKNITVEYLFMLLNERINNGKYTVVATNLGPQQMLERYGERVMSRLMDRSLGWLIRLTGADLRLGGNA